MKEMITSLTQTEDGYLWFGTNLGLVRFDGVRAVRWQPPNGQPLPSDFITAITGAPDGALWIGTNQGLARWQNASLTSYADVAGENVSAIVASADGTVWFGLSEPGRLCAIRADKVRCSGASQLGTVVNSVLEDSTRALWVGASTGLWKWSPGEPVRYALPGDEVGPIGLVQGNAGRIIVATQGGLKRLVGPTVERYPLRGDGRDSTPWNVIRTSDGSLWVGTSDGVLHLHEGKTDRFTETDGLSARQVLGVLEDREGNVWVSTTEGLDRFRVAAVSTISSKQGLSHSVALSVLASRDGGVWVGTPAGLDLWTNATPDRVTRATETNLTAPWHR